MHLVAPPEAIEGGEAIKTDPKHLDYLQTRIHETRIDRHSYVIAIGGGAVLDASRTGLRDGASRCASYPGSDDRAGPERQRGRRQERGQSEWHQELHRNLCAALGRAERSRFH